MPYLIQIIGVKIEGLIFRSRKNRRPKRAAE
jgi:hypothetical protein